jgi:hypothetical protein
MKMDSKLAGLDIDMIKEITDIYEICNQYRKMFCFAITLNNEEVINVFRKYDSNTRKSVEKEIRNEHLKLCQSFSYYKNKINK